MFIWSINWTLRDGERFYDMSKWQNVAAAAARAAHINGTIKYSIECEHNLLIMPMFACPPAHSCSLLNAAALSLVIFKISPLNMLILFLFLLLRLLESFKIHHHPFWHVHIKSLCFLSNSAWSLKCYTFFMLKCKSIQFQHTNSNAHSHVFERFTQTCAKWDFARLLGIANEKSKTTTMQNSAGFGFVFSNDFCLTKCSNVFVAYKLQWLLCVRVCACTGVNETLDS